jgi:hypothetical protein
VWAYIALHNHYGVDGGASLSGLRGSLRGSGSGEGWVRGVKATLLF